MNEFPDPDAGPAAPERSPSASAVSGGGMDSREIKVPRSIVVWSKWRKAARRAEHREARRTQQRTKVRPSLMPGVAPSPHPAGEPRAAGGAPETRRRADEGSPRPSGRSPR